MSELLKKVYKLCQNNDIIALILAIKSVPNINQHYEGKTLLYIACYYGHIEITKILLEKGADPNVRSVGSTNMYIATWYNYPNIVKILVKFGANVDDTNIGTIFSPLCYAIYREYTDIVKILVNSKADVNYSVDGKNTRPLHLACQTRNFEIIKTLLDYGADINYRDEYKLLPMFYIVNNVTYSKVKEATPELLKLLSQHSEQVIYKSLNPNAPEWIPNVPS
jgi:ankyrin repeat protein